MSKRKHVKRQYRPTHKQKTGQGRLVVLLILIIIGAAFLLKDNWMPIAEPTSKQVDYATNITPKKPAISTGMLRANTAKLIAYTFYTTDEIQQLERIIELEDTLPSFWYDKYINAVANLGYMGGDDNKFQPMEFVTYEQVINILKEVSEDEYNIELKSGDQVADKKISMQQFINIYSQLLQKLSPDQSIGKSYDIHEKDIIVLSTPANDESLGAWRVATDQGEYGFEGISIDAYIDHKIKVLVKNNEILGIIDVISSDPSFESVYIENIANGQVEVMVGGVKKTYDADLLDETYIDQLVDLHFKDGQIIGVDIKEEEYKDRVLKVGDGMIETERSGVLPISDSLKIYDLTQEGVQWSRLSSIIVGTPDIEYALSDGKINTITIKKKPNMRKIRILLGTTDFADKIHEAVAITSEGSFVVDFYGDQKTYEPGEVMDVKQWSKKMSLEKPRIRIIPSNDHKLKVETITRRETQPLYSGTLEVCKEKDGGYTLINEVSIEDYVAAVIPSEMPTSYGIEACKVQAITARSYAYVHMANNKFGEYGANLDDSTNSQVYNNIPADEISLLAAEETAGKVLQYNGQAISANCFATSSGYTANYGEVWANPDGTFPANTPVYLVSKEQYEGEEIVPEMKDEANAYKFFTATGASLDAYDHQSPWFRWKVTMSAKEITQSVNSGIKKRYSVNPQLIKTLGKDRVFRPKDINDIGEVEKIQVHKRGEGGNIMELIIYGSEDTIKVLTEYNIRTLLSPMQRIEGAEPIVIKRQDATEVKNFEMLPSAFFAIDAKYDKNEKLQSVTFYGGGFGHGVGMSQDGVRGMIERGYSYQEILSHYYPETRVGSMN